MLTAYPAWMRTIEAIRLANFSRLVDELKGEGREAIKSPEVASALGISAVYAWQLLSGKRDSIDSKGARTMERKMGKPEGWLDTDFEMWPFPDANLLQAIEGLNRDRRLELQGVIRRHLNDLGVQSAPAFEGVPVADRPNFTRPMTGKKPASKQKDAP